MILLLLILYYRIFNGLTQEAGAARERDVKDLIIIFCFAAARQRLQEAVIERDGQRQTAQQRVQQQAKRVAPRCACRFPHGVGEAVGTWAAGGIAK